MTGTRNNQGVSHPQRHDWDARRRHAVYASQQAAEPDRIAQRIAFHHARLCKQSPPSKPITGSPL
ncbi:hypothetical protein [Streptosporangium lutulentum]|uniref:NADP-dependent 3-hydroxy acid dehydrogenase YdfG n=1 Tax=Streptosporangium lutulentum TaxID=1461250 RepID=A0ABT9QEE4_9ACTN|nr:hypothetical protein [Streptosporangium lutulentum]MDP9844314.1 NADP-dependent 3-hydroxy acid dehydrogenase YdfG [Streptosporangium lutulentum]